MSRLTKRAIRYGRTEGQTDHNYRKVTFSKIKDDNIHKSEALKWKDKSTLTLVECQN